MQVKLENKKFNLKSSSEGNKHLGNITNQIAKNLQSFTFNCSKHSSQIITNFCSNMKCLIPLCPDCIQGHLQHHRQSKLTQEVQSIKASRIKSIQKLQKLAQFISNEMIALEEPMQMGDILQTTIERIKQIKQEVLMYLDKYFDELEYDLIERIKNSQSVIVKIDSLYKSMKQKINNINNDCQLLKSNHQSIPAKIRQVIEIDSTQQNLKFNKLMEEYNKNLNKIQMIINFDRKKFETIFEQTIKVQFKAKPDDIDQYVLMQDNIKYGRTPVLHYFQSGSPYLHLIQFPRQNKKKFELKNNWKVPHYHTSLLMSNGDVLLSGGIHVAKPAKYHNFVSKFDTFKYTFDLGYIKVSQRYEHSLVQMNGCLFIMAGYKKMAPDGTQVEQKRVEKVRFSDFKVIEMKESSFGGPSRAIVKNGSIFKICKKGLEMFTMTKGDQTQQRWTELHIPDFVFNDQCAAVNINGDFIFVFGGYENIKKVAPKAVAESEFEEFSQNESIDNNESQLPTFIQEKKPSKASFFIDISDINVINLVNKGKYDLQIPGGFKNNIPIFYKKHIYALQNFQNLNGDDDDSERTILKFDGRKWQLLQ